MGINHSSHTNLGSDCTVEAGATGATVRWGESFEISMGTFKTDNDHTDVWGVDYKVGNGRKKHNCGFSLSARRDYTGVLESISLGLEDKYGENRTSFSLEMIKTCHGLRGGVKFIDSCGGKPLMTFTRATENYTVETTIVSYGCSQREGLFVLEKRKYVNSDDAYMVTLAHYYLTKDRGLSVAAKFFATGMSCFGVEVEGPINHPSADLRKVLVQTCVTGEWSPAACSHCSGEKERTRIKVRVSKSSHKTQSYHTQSEEKVGQIIKYVFRGPFYSNYDNGIHTYTGSKINSGSNSGNRYHHRNYDNHSSNSINNSGTFYGNGNGGSIGGNFDASTWNYN